MAGMVERRTPWAVWLATTIASLASLLAMWILNNVAQDIRSLEIERLTISSRLSSVESEAAHVEGLRQMVVLLQQRVPPEIPVPWMVRRLDKLEDAVERASAKAARAEAACRKGGK